MRHALRILNAHSSPLLTNLSTVESEAFRYSAACARVRISHSELVLVSLFSSIGILPSPLLLLRLWWARYVRTWAMGGSRCKFE